METVRKILERKWKLIHQTFWFDRDNFEFLFDDFKEHLMETTELKGILSKLQEKKVIPSDFFKNKNENSSWRKIKDEYSDPIRDDFKLIERIYVFILNEIDFIKTKGNNEIKKETERLCFDENKSCLSYRNHTIKIRKFSDQYHALRIILKEPEEYIKEWFFSELTEKIDSEKNNDKTYYNAFYQLNQKLAIAGFPNFFITTRQSAKINTEYLS